MRYKGLISPGFGKTSLFANGKSTRESNRSSQISVPIILSYMHLEFCTDYTSNIKYI